MYILDILYKHTYTYISRRTVYIYYMCTYNYMFVNALSNSILSLVTRDKPADKQNGCVPPAVTVIKLSKFCHRHKDKYIH